jgi:hypothetical protein
MGFSDWLKKASEKVTTKQISPSENVGIRLEGRALQDENSKFREIAEAIIQDIAGSGCFKEEKLSIVNARIKKMVRPGYGYSDPFSLDDCLSLEEKKALGLNTRQKYSREFIEALSEKGLSHPDLKDILKVVYLKHFHSIHRKYELLRMKRLGIKTVKIEDCGDERDCKAIKRLKKRWPIDEVPELPLPSCTAEYCRCTYISDQSS